MYARCVCTLDPSPYVLVSSATTRGQLSRTCRSGANPCTFERQELCHIDDNALARRTLVEIRAAGQNPHQPGACDLSAAGVGQQQLVETHQAVRSDDLRLEARWQL